MKRWWSSTVSFMKRLLEEAFLYIVIVCSSCSSVQSQTSYSPPILSTREEVAEHHQGYTPLTIDELLECEQEYDAKHGVSTLSIFQGFHSGLKPYAQCIYFIDDTLFKSEDDERFPNGVAAHAHSDIGVICVPDSSLSYVWLLYRVLLHEVTHIKHFALDSEHSDFSQRWNIVSDVEYGTISRSTSFGFEWVSGGISPQFGCLNPYSGMSIKEDVAEFVGALAGMECRSPQDIQNSVDVHHGRNTPEDCSWDAYRTEQEEKFVSLAEELNTTIPALFMHVVPLYFCDPSDPRYIQKIHLLREYDFISEEQERMMADRAGCLRSLLDE